MDCHDANDAIEFLRVYALHRQRVRASMLGITSELERRAITHDTSKIWPDEFATFVRMNGVAREHAYGSDEYAASLKAEATGIARHYERNRHHPEHFVSPREMTAIDIIEMVVDWRSAYETYSAGRTNPMDWRANLGHQRERFDFSPEQWWLVEQIASFLERQAVS